VRRQTNLQRLFVFDLRRRRQQGGGEQHELARGGRRRLQGGISRHLHSPCSSQPRAQSPTARPPWECESHWCESASGGWRVRDAGGEAAEAIFVLQMPEARTRCCRQSSKRKLIAPARRAGQADAYRAA
jgi:hypothetical protein